jgi:hypothetical protein
MELPSHPNRSEWLSRAALGLILAIFPAALLGYQFWLRPALSDLRTIDIVAAARRLVGFSRMPSGWPLEKPFVCVSLCPMSHIKTVIDRADKARTTAEQVQADAEAAIAANIFRRRAMVIAVAFIVLTIVALYLLKRELDRRLDSES